MWLIAYMCCTCVLWLCWCACVVLSIIVRQQLAHHIFQWNAHSAVMLSNVWEFQAAVARHNARQPCAACVCVVQMRCTWDVVACCACGYALPIACVVCVVVFVFNVVGAWRVIMILHGLFNGISCIRAYCQWLFNTWCVFACLCALLLSCVCGYCLAYVCGVFVYACVCAGWLVTCVVNYCCALLSFNILIKSCITTCDDILNSHVGS